ncbi:MAG: hypothetical protein JNJ73_13805 [Hyphomonadaceae bacterium]|nr:hypothetical protein [Hyphomonadaceae bacterium]
MAEETQRFTMTEAALDVFRRRERRGVLIRATLLFYALFALLGGLFVAAFSTTIAEVIAELARAAESSTAPDFALFAGMWRLASGMLLFQLCYSLLLAAYEAACLRWLVRGETRGIFGFALDADAWRVWASFWIWLGLLAGLAAIPWSLTLVTIATATEANAPGAVFAVFLAVLATIAAGVWLAVRLAPATAASIVAQRFAFFDAWKVTRGRFGSMLGAFFLVIVAYYIVGSALQALVAPVMFGMLFKIAATPPAEFSLDTMLAPLRSPWMIAAISASVLLSVAAAAVLRLAFFGVNARAVRAARGEGAI